MGIEPIYFAWKANNLPLIDTRIYIYIYMLIAQLDRVSDYESEGWEFESF